MSEKMTIVVEQQEKKKRGGVLAAALTIALVAVLCVGSTLAYLTYTTNQAANRFTVGDAKVTADLLEPEWDKAVAAADAASVASDGTKIPDGAYNMLPASEAAKNPFVVNTSANGATGYAGMKLQFEKYNGTAYVPMTNDDVTALLKVYALSTATGTKTPGLTTAAGWTACAGAGYDTEAGAKYYYYATELQAETTAEHTAEDATETLGIPEAKRTTPLFSYVRFAENATQADVDALNTILTTASAAKPGWRVTVSGAVIGSEGLTETAPDFVDTTKTLSWKSVLDAAPAAAAGTGVRA